MHPDRMHLHHRMLKIGHSVQSAVLILWGWAALIAFGSIMILFFEAEYVAIGFVIACIALTVVTLYPYYRRRIPEIRAENAALAAAKRREHAHHAQSQEAKAEIDASTAAEQARNEAGHVGPVTSDSRQSDSLTSDSSGRDATSHRHARRFR
jgi:UDP-GlcNAc:undecaprenyl-phosphate GlcNAc-1-phosphate transferase